MKEFLFAVACLTQAEIFNAECRIACRKTGYESGVYSNKICWCSDRYDYDQITEKKIKIAIPSSSNQIFIDKPTIHVMDDE